MSIINAEGRKIVLAGRAGREVFNDASHVFATSKAVQQNPKRASLVINQNNVVYDFGRDSTFVHYGDPGRVHSASFGLGEAGRIQRVKDILLQREELDTLQKEINGAERIMVGDNFVIIGAM
jgi:hypothetical protein